MERKEKERRELEEERRKEEGGRPTYREPARKKITQI